MPEVTPEFVRQLLDSDFPEVDLHPAAPYIAAAYLQVCEERDELAAKVARVEAAIADANWNSHRMVSTRRLDEVLGGSDV